MTLYQENNVWPVEVKFQEIVRNIHFSEHILKHRLDGVQIFELAGQKIVPVKRAILILQRLHGDV